MQDVRRSHKGFILLVSILLMQLLTTICIANPIGHIAEDGKTPLYRAVMECPRQYLSGDESKKQQCYKTVKKLLELGADPNFSISGKSGDTPMSLMIRWQYVPEVFDLLVEYGGDIDSKWGNKTAMYYMIENGDIQGVEKLIKLGIQADHTMCCEENGGMKPLNKLALSSGNTEVSIRIAKILVKHGADVDHFYQKATPLISAIWRQDEDFVRFLIESGASVNLGLPVFDAIARENETITKLILSAGADINVKNKHGKSPLWLAKKKHKKRVANMLIQLGAVD